MDKDLNNYEKEIQNQISVLKGLKVNEKHQRATDLLNYHNIRVGNFQHERLIHLLVTFFFGSLLIIGSIVLYIPKASDYSFLDTMVSAIIAVLFVVELFYIRHYYFLENGTQRLYKYSKELFELIEK